MLELAETPHAFLKETGKIKHILYSSVFTAQFVKEKIRIKALLMLMFKYHECSFEGVESYSAEHFCIKVSSGLIMLNNIQYFKCQCGKQALH